jgi:type IV pilus assembly protein PilM
MLDWLVIPTDKPTTSEFEMEEVESAKKSVDKVEVLLVVIHNDAVIKMQDILKLASLKATFFEIEIFSTIRSVLDREGSPVMILDLGAGSTKLYIVDKGILRSSHIVNQGSQDLTMALSKSLSIPSEAAESMKRNDALGGRADSSEILNVVSSTLSFIFSEASRVLLNFQKKYYRNIGKVILTGGGVGLRGFKELAEQSFGVPVEMANPFLKTDSPVFLENVLKKVGPEFAVALGLALRKLQEKE